MPPKLDAETRARLRELRREERELLKPMQEAQRAARTADRQSRATKPHPTGQARLRPSRGREIDKAHKGMIAQLFCLATAIREGREVYGVHVAHVRQTYPHEGWANPGLQRKPDDWRTLPLAPEEHARQHSGNEGAYYRELGVYPPALCGELKAVSPDVEAAKRVLREHVKAARMTRGIRGNEIRRAG